MHEYLELLLAICVLITILPERKKTATPLAQFLFIATAWWGVLTMIETSNLVWPLLAMIYAALETVLKNVQKTV